MTRSEGRETKAVESFLPLFWLIWESSYAINSRPISALAKGESDWLLAWEKGSLMACELFFCFSWNSRLAFWRAKFSVF